MAYSLTVRVERIVCRDRESLSEYDAFALAGGVIVDGALTTFARPPIAMNERIEGSYSPREAVIFSGFTSSRQIGLVLRGYDIDNNDWWQKNRKDLTKASETLADFVGYVPVVGDYAAKILKAWPKVVDAVVSLDKDDVLLNLATTVTLPDVSPLLFKDSYHPVEIRFNREDPTGYSDWDYSLFLGFVYQNLEVPSFGRVPEQSLRPYRRSSAKDWVGDWTAENVSCRITRSIHGTRLLDVSVTERSRGSTTTTETLAVPISKLFLERVAAYSAVDARIEGAVQPGPGDHDFARLVVERATGPHAAVVEATTSFALTKHHGAVLERAASRNKPRVTSEIELVPQRERSGADLLELGGDAVLEIYQVLHDGKSTPGFELRYIRPVSSLAMLSLGAVDTMLRPYVHIT